MIRGFEQQVGAWIQQIAIESLPLFGAPAVAVSVTKLTPAPEHRDLGPPPVTEDDLMRLRAEVTVALSGPVTEAAGLAISPAGAGVHQVDLLALTILARLRERSKPGADGAQGYHGGSRGAITVQAGARVGQLRWAALEAGPPVLVAGGEDNRIWHLPLTATLEFRLSTVPVDGGRIQKIALYQDFVPADRLPLAAFIGLEGYLLQRLARRDLHQLGDLAGMNATELADELEITELGARQALAALQTVAAARQGFPAPSPFNDMISEVLWLPARALLEPNPGEDAILRRAMAQPLTALTIAVLGTGTAVVLRPELRESTLIGRLLAQE